MAIAKMAKVMIASHRSQAAELFESIQSEGIFHILNPGETVIGQQYPDLKAAAYRPKDIEVLVVNLQRCIEFLSKYGDPKKNKRSILTPLPVIDKRQYKSIVSDSKLKDLVDHCISLEESIDKTGSRIEELEGMISDLQPWKSLDTPVELMEDLVSATCLAGFIPSNAFEQVKVDLEEAGAVVDVIGRDSNRHACIVVCLGEALEPAQKLLRSAEFVSANFAGLTGTVAEIIDQYTDQLKQLKSQREGFRKEADQLTENLLNLEILLDHTKNLLEREQTHSESHATQSAVLIEGWVKRQDLLRLKAIVKKCGASDIMEVGPAEGELPPVEIENKMAVKPFEVITRLYGMPDSTDVDPTVFLAPFFALFFGVCMTDAGYGIIMLAFFIWLSRKIKFARAFSHMMIFCSITSIVAGALTGGWCADSVGVFLPQLAGVREKMLWFDPLVGDGPMYFFTISLALGYLQIIFGVGLAFLHKYRNGEKKEAVCDHLTWFVWLNALAIYGLGKGGYLPGALATAAGYIAIIPAIGILLFSEREGGWGNRIGMGAYNLFSTVFFVGDVLSYVRLMALGMVTAGFGMAINEISKQLMGVPYVGWLIGGIVFAGGHIFNVANSALSGFVHSMRLQFVEFFTKFLKGGGKQFEPLRKEYKYVQVKKY